VDISINEMLKINHACVTMAVGYNFSRKAKKTAASSPGTKPGLATEVL